MNRSATALLATTAALAVVPAALAAPAAAKRITVIEHATTDTTTDTGKKGDSVGDVLTFHNKVYDAADKKVVGHDQGYCIRVDTKGGSYECNWTTFLKGGQITVQGPFFDKHNSTLAITGGTGRYRRARGEMKLVSRKGGKEFAFRFRLVKP